MVNVDQDSPIGDAIAHLAEPLEAGAVDGHDTIKSPASLGKLEELLRVEEGELCRHRMLVPAGDHLPFILERDGKAKLRADAIPVGSDVANDADRATLADGLDDSLDDAA